MPERADLMAVAREYRKQLDGLAFLTVHRSGLTRKLREVSGEPRTKLKSGLAQGLTEELETLGVQAHPALGNTLTGYARLYHAGSLYGQMVSHTNRPDPSTDYEVAIMLRKLKGRWRWPSVGEEPADTDVGVDDQDEDEAA